MKKVILPVALCVLMSGCTLNMVDVELTNNAEGGSTANWSAAGATWNSEKTQSATGTVPSEAVTDLLKSVIPDSDIIKMLKEKLNPSSSSQTGTVVTPVAPVDTVTPEPEI